MDLDVWVSVNSGSEHNCALKYDGTAMCWGWRGLSKVGDGRIRLPSTPDWERDSQGGYTWRQLALGDAFSCGKWDDERMATLSYAALAGWYELFPERRANELYLTGESYAGIYVPKLAQQILLHGDPHVRPQFKGFAVGDGCLGTESGVCGSLPGGKGPWWDVLFLYGHHQISTELFDTLVDKCGMPYLKYDQPAVAPAACHAAMGQVDEEKGGYFGCEIAQGPEPRIG